MSTPTMVSGYTNVSLSDSATTTAPQGDGSFGFSYNGEVIYHVTRALLACGATCTGSSTRTSGTGTAANAMTATDQWSGGAYNTAYQNAWWACSITLNSVQWNFVFQVGGTGSPGVRIKVSVGAGNEFTDSGGSASATRTKAISGEGYVMGGGTDASPSYDAIPSSGASYYLSSWWDSATGYFGLSMHLAAGSAKNGAGFVFATLPLDASTVLSTRCQHVVLCSSGSVLTAATIDETSTISRAVYRCRQGLSSTAFANVKPKGRVVVDTTATDPGTGDKIDSLLSWNRDTAPVDSGGLTPDAILLGQTTSVPTMQDVMPNPNVTGTVRRYLCLGDIGLRVPNSFVSN